MDRQTCEDTLRQFERQEQYQPFVIEMRDGRFQFVVEPRLSFSGGAAVFFHAVNDAVFLGCQEVSCIRAATPPGSCRRD